MAKVKGSAIVGSVRILRGNKDKARAQLAPALHHYLSERVLAATWYPGEDMIPLLKAVAKVLGEPEQGFYEKAGRQSAQLHADGVYKHLVRAEDAEGFARRALVLWSSQHDTGRTDTRTDEHGRVHVSLRDFALPSREHCAITAGYIAAVFEFSGCKHVRVQKQSCCVDRDPECSWVVDWDRQP